MSFSYDINTIIIKSLLKPFLISTSILKCERTAVFISSWSMQAFSEQFRFCETIGSSKHLFKGPAAEFQGTLHLKMKIGPIYNGTI